MGEAGLAQKLDILLKAKELKKVEPQKTFTLYGMNRGKVCSHRVDFFVTYPNGTQEVFEFKGFATAEWRIKYKLFQDNYPHIKYNVVTGNYIVWKSKNQ